MRCIHRPHCCFGGFDRGAVDPPLRVLLHAPGALAMAGLSAILESGERHPAIVAQRVMHCQQLPEPTRARQYDVLVSHPSCESLLRPTAPVIVAAEQFGGVAVVSWLKDGVLGIISTGDDLKALPGACVSVASGMPYLSPSALVAMVEHVSGRSKRLSIESGVTAREVDVIQQLVEGKTTLEIAHRLQITQRTVKHHLENLYSKLGARNAAQAVAIALRKGLVV